MRWRTLDQFVAQSLMIPFAMIVADKLRDSAVVSRACGERDAKSFTLLGVVIEQPTETLVPTHSTATPLLHDRRQ